MLTITRYRIYFRMDQGPCGEWLERDNGALANIQVTIHDTYTQEARGELLGELLSVYEVETSQPAALEAALNSCADCISYREIARS